MYLRAAGGRVAILERWRKAHLGHLLGGLTAGAFVARHWHKEPLLVRGAMPGFTGVATRDELFALAARDDVASRLVRKQRQPLFARAWPVQPRAARAAAAPRLDAARAGVNLHSDAADALLRRFAFIPYARLDDVMVSYAAPGGGVGPHFDSYDVFLLQAHGRRRWRYGRQSDLALRPDVPLEDPAALRADRTTRRSRPATCSTCRRTSRTTARPSTNA